MNKKLKLQLLLRSKTEGTLLTIEIDANITAPKEISEHDLADHLFSCKTAINDYASVNCVILSYE